MKTSLRWQEYKVFLYRMGLVFLFYQLARVLFYFYNQDLIIVDSIGSFFRICFYGFIFDTSAIVYTNILFIFLSILPLVINTSKGYQRLLFWVYIITNAISYATNFIDFVYYKYTFARSTTAITESIKHEENKMVLLGSFIIHYWHVFLIFSSCIFLWVKLYKKVQIVPYQYPNKKVYFGSSLLAFLIIIFFSVIGARGDFEWVNRPINMVQASSYSKNVEASSLILNTPFCIIRTLGKNHFKEMHDIPEVVVDSLIKPINQYDRHSIIKPNIVVFIVESFAREYVGAFNKKTKIKDYMGYTPFIDSLATSSLIFPNAYANGRKSIHAMSSILAGIPSFEVAYTSSPYASRKTNSIVSAANEMGYDTSFFHGASDGSMGFLGYANILGFDHYYGRTEYNNEKDFNGYWGISDRPFMTYVADELTKKQQPFMATIFTLSSHDPYVLPEDEKGKYPMGHLPIHKCIGYVDDSFRDFFRKISKTSWYDHTIFVITADHTNQIYYNEYKKMINRFAVPILIYAPTPDLIRLQGEDYSLAGQIDIYPTLIDLMGYNKPIRSWGRSLVRFKKQSNPYAITSNGSTYFFLQDSLIYSMDENMKTRGFYDIKDKGLVHNLKNNLTSVQKQSVEVRAKSFVQDYMNRITGDRLYVKKEK